MSEPIIHDSTPKGSAILAYGESSPRSRLPILIGLGVAAAVVFAVVAIGAFLFQPSLPIPSQTVALAYLQPSVRIPDNAPSVWKTTQIMAKPMPIMVGYETAADGSWQPFAIAWRFPHLQNGEAHGMWQIVRTSRDTQLTTASPGSLAPSVFAYPSSNWLRVWPKRALGSREDGNTASLEDSIVGALHASSWTTDAPIHDVMASTSVIGPNEIDIATLPQAWPLLENALRARGVILDLGTEPSRVAWAVDEKNDISVRLSFADSLTTSTKTEIAGSVGIYDNGKYTLPDNTVMDENRLPVQTMMNSTSTTWNLEDGRTLVFDGNTVTIGKPDAFADIQAISGCPGQTVATFDTSSLKGLLNNTGLDLLRGIQRLDWTAQNGKTTICWQ